MLGALRLTPRRAQTTLRALAPGPQGSGADGGLGGEQRTMSVLALGSAHSRGLPAHSLLPAAPVALASPAAGPSWTGGLLGACRCISFRRRAGKQKMRIHHPKTAKGRKALRHPRFEWKIYKGDVVGVNRGRFQGMVGEVIRTHKRYHELRVKGVNVVRRKVWDFKTDPESPQRVWVDREEPIHYSRVSWSIRSPGAHQARLALPRER